MQNKNVFNYHLSDNLFEDLFNINRSQSDYTEQRNKKSELQEFTKYTRQTLSKIKSTRYSMLKLIAKPKPIGKTDMFTGAIEFFNNAKLELSFGNNDYICDCCGKQLNALNSVKNYGICIDCYKHFHKPRIIEPKINRTLTNPLLEYL